MVLLRLDYHVANLSASLEISLPYQAIYYYLLDNLVSGPLFVPTVIAALHPSNRLWAPVCFDLLWRSQAASVDGKDLTSLCHDLAKQLSHYLYFFSFLLSWTYYTEGSVGKCHVTSVIWSWSHDRKSQHHIT